MAVYPGGVRDWTIKRDFSQDIIESHMNDIQSELVAGQRVWGVNPHIATSNPGGLRRDYGTVGDRLTSMVYGEHLPYYQAALINYPIYPSDQAQNPDIPSQDPDGRDLDWCGPGRRQRAKKLRLRNGDEVWLPYHWRVPNPDGDEAPWCGLPLEQDEATVADGGWQRLPIVGQDDPFLMGLGDGFRLNETGLWMISLKVDHMPSEDTVTVRARRRARLEINGRSATLQHLVRENEHNSMFLTNWVNWIEVLPAGTVITASARVDGTDLSAATPVNAYMRAHLIRCTSEEDDGMLTDFPQSIYKPPPPKPTPRPSVPSTPTPDSYEPDYSGGSVIIGGNASKPYAVEIRPGEWYGYYGWGTAGPQDGPFFPGIGTSGTVFG